MGGVGQQYCAHTCRALLLLVSRRRGLLPRVRVPAWCLTHRTPCRQRITRASGALLTLHVGTQHSNVVALRTSVSMRHELKDKDTRAFRLGGWWEARGRRPQILFRREQRRRFWRRFLRPSPMPPPAALAALLAHAASSVLAAAALAALHPHAAASAFAPARAVAPAAALAAALAAPTHALHAVVLPPTCCRGVRAVAHARG